MSAGLPRLDFYPRDWFLGTRNLSREQRGIYIDLLAAMYARGGPLPYRPEELRALLGEKSVRVVIRVVNELIEKEKIQVVDGDLVNDRALREIEAFRQRLELSARGGNASKRRLNSRRGEKRQHQDKPKAKRCLNSAKDSSELAEGFQSVQRIRGDQPPAPSSPPSPTLERAVSKEKETEPNETSKPRRGARLPEGWQPSSADIAYANSLGYDDRTVRDLAKDFLFYWTDGSGRNKTMRDWSKCWQSWCRKDRRRPGSSGQSGRDTKDPSAHQKWFEGFARAASRKQ